MCIIPPSPLQFYILLMLRVVRRHNNLCFFLAIATTTTTTTTTVGRRGRKRGHVPHVCVVAAAAAVVVSVRRFSFPADFVCAAEVALAGVVAEPRVEMVVAAAVAAGAAVPSA